MKYAYEHIQNLVETTFREFLGDFLNLNKNPLKYYYWTKEFFAINAGLTFSHFNLELDEREEINRLGKQLFEDSEVAFEISKSSQRYELNIRNIHKLFPKEKKSGQGNRYDYLKEFVFWLTLQETAKSEIPVDPRTVEQQEKNFLVTYLDYLITYTKKPSFDELKGYKRYDLTSQGQELLEKLDDLEKKKIKNTSLRKKLSTLYVHRKQESKLHFVFSRIQGGEKEELRELLDIMGKKASGRFYRGQANALWKLDSSLTRDEDYLQKESQMYYEILSLKPDAFINDNSVYERLITMQHFGMPTRLMDITRNPLVAIFFACNNRELAKCDGIIYTFTKEDKDFINFEDPKLLGLKSLFDSSIIPNEPQTEFLKSVDFIRGVAKNPRINNQSGDFIFVGTSDKVEQQLNDLPTLNIIIDSSTKKVLLEQLESLNIHGGAVYPDLTSMSNFIKNKYHKLTTEDEDDFTIGLDIDSFEDSIASKSSNERFSFNPENVVVLTSDYDSDSFWTQERKTEVDKFIEEHKLERAGFVKILENLIAFNTPPIRGDIFNIMKEKPRLKEIELVIGPLIADMTSLAHRLKNDFN